jgi:hypothetical protein
MTAAAPAGMAAGAFAAALDPARDAVWAAMMMRDWRIKPQMVPKRASTRSAVMIMTITQAVRRLVAGGGDFTS